MFTLYRETTREWRSGCSHLCFFRWPGFRHGVRASIPRLLHQPMGPKTESSAEVVCVFWGVWIEWYPSVDTRKQWKDMGVSNNMGTPKWMVCNGNPIKMDDLGVPYFWKHPYGNHFVGRGSDSPDSPDSPSHSSLNLEETHGQRFFGEFQSMLYTTLSILTDLNRIEPFRVLISRSLNLAQVESDGLKLKKTSTCFTGVDGPLTRKATFWHRFIIQSMEILMNKLPKPWNLGFCGCLSFDMFHVSDGPSLW